MVDIERQLEFTGPNEGLRLKTYKCPAGFDTIGYGHNLEASGLPEDMLFEVDVPTGPGEWDGLEITEDFANRLFAVDAREAWNELLKIFPDLEMYSESRQIALTDMMFNMGAKTFRKFKNMIAAIQLGMWHVAAKEAKESDWYRQVTNRADKVIARLKG